MTTNSLCQGEQVPLLWPIVLNMGVEIGFAHQSFKWRNNAAANAGVTCVLVGLRPKSSVKKLIFTDDLVRVVKNISPYLIEFSDLVVEKRSTPLSEFPRIDFGSMANDNGALLLSREDRDHLLNANSKAGKIIRKLTGSQEIIKGIERWCLWIRDEDLPLAKSIPQVAKRIDACRAHRLDSGRDGTKALAEVSYRFAEVRQSDAEALVVPLHFSEDRPYLTIGLVDGADTVVANSASAIFNPPGHLFAVLSSRMHQVWTAAVGGQLETRLRYSNSMVYNTFPMPSLSKGQREALEFHGMEVLAARERHPGATIATLYDPEAMPEDLRTAHRALDEALETIYAGRPFGTDTERLEHMFKVYSVMTQRQISIAPAQRRNARMKNA